METIEKWKSEKQEDLSEWELEVEEAMEKGEIYKNVNDPIPLSLTLHGMDDELLVETDDIANGIVRIEVNEETHEATDLRDENMEYIKLFMERYVPYLKFQSQKERDDYHSTYGFDLIYSVEV
ncbi:hypothetical protein ACNF40_06570 [Cuniculiplasma sp. SKW4]|uniref:hypothetical protein n=1 Tax=Cuniculiplasma sp. SKW4 TaxID=3400171 RepID=UPI003FD3C85D